MCPVFQGFAKSRGEPGRTSEKDHHEYSGDESPYEQHQRHHKHLMLVHRHAVTYTRKHVYGPSCDKRICFVAVGPRAASHFLRTRKLCVYGSKLESPTFCASCVKGVFVVLLVEGFDIAALKSSGAE